METPPSLPDPTTTPPTKETIGAWLARAKPSTPQGWIFAVVVGLLTVNVAMDIGRKAGIGDELYPFATQVQYQELLEQVEALAQDQGALMGMTCGIVAAVGGDLPDECGE